MAGVDAALVAHPWIDGDNLGVFGGSYGGFMSVKNEKCCILNEQFRLNNEAFCERKQGFLYYK